MQRLIFAANWKMHLGPRGARAFLDTFLAGYRNREDREVWFFPGAVALEAVAAALPAGSGLGAGVQDVHWEEGGAFTGAVSVPMAREAGATMALVGHSERRHVFGETDEETGKKVRAVLAGGLTPVLCVGERLAEREDGRTMDVVRRQLGVLEGLEPEAVARVVVAYEPVWAIGTGKTATPNDAGQVHGGIRSWLAERGVPGEGIRILYGGSVKPKNAAELAAQREIDGVLVGGASLDPESWLEIIAA